MIPVNEDLIVNAVRNVKAVVNIASVRTVHDQLFSNITNIISL
jgi:hypothetical protein